MKAATLTSPQQVWQRPLRVGEVAQPVPKPGQVLMRVRVCGVCRTDLHIVEGDLPPSRPGVIPGHQIVGEVVSGNAAGATERLPVGTRVGVSWMGGTDGTCRYCRLGLENLCDSPTFTGYTVAGVKHGDRVGLFGFGASAHLAIAVLRSWNCEVYVSTRGATHRLLAASLGATWVGSETDKPPAELDCAVTFAPSGDVVVAALASLRKGGVVAINAIHLDRIPQFDYDRLLWGERQLRSVANMTRADARDFLQVAREIGLRPKVTVFPLDQVNEALIAVKEDSIDGAAVITM